MVSYTQITCLLLFLGVCRGHGGEEHTVFASAGTLDSEDPNNSQGRRLLTSQNGSSWKWTPGYVSATLADAYAEVLKTKAQAKYNHSIPQIIPMPQVLPSNVPTKSKNFSYTSIKLSTQASGNISSPFLLETVPVAQQQAQVPPVPSPFITTTTPPIPTQVSGARPTEISGAPIPTGAVTNPFVTQPNYYNTPVPSTPPTALDLQNKLALLQAQLQQLEAMQAQLDKSSLSSTPPQSVSSRRLLDSGLPGWDPGALFEKKLDILSVEAELLQERMARDASYLQSQMHDRLNAMGTVATVTGDTLSAMHTDLSTALDNMKNRMEERAGNVQDFLGKAMDAYAARKLARMSQDHRNPFDLFF